MSSLEHHTSLTPDELSHTGSTETDDLLRAMIETWCLAAGNEESQSAVVDFVLPWAGEDQVNIRVKFQKPFVHPVAWSLVGPPESLTRTRLVFDFSRPIRFVPLPMALTRVDGFELNVHTVFDGPSTCAGTQLLGDWNFPAGTVSASQAEETKLRICELQRVLETYKTVQRVLETYKTDADETREGGRDTLADFLWRELNIMTKPASRL